MCFDTEKTQAPRDRNAEKHVLSERENRLRQGVPLDRIAGDGAYAMETRTPMSDAQIVAELFKYHAPTPEQIPLYGAINQAAKNFAEVILSTCPRGADRTAAIRLLRDARMTANAAIALDGLSL